MIRRTVVDGTRSLFARAIVAALVPLASCTSAAGTSPCGGELTDCGVCVPLAYDARNCGACGNLCANALACVRGACVSDPAGSGGGGGGGHAGRGGASDGNAGGSGGSGGSGTLVGGGSGAAGAVGVAGGPSTGGSGGGCAAPLTLCGGTCVDVAHDALHCGSCEGDCSLGVCELGVCSPVAVGHQILFGMDFSKIPGNHTGERRMLGNAAFLGVSSAGGHWKVVGFDPHASPTVPAVDGMLKSEAPSRGVTDLEIVHLDTVAAMLATVSPAQANVVVVYDQPKASVGELSALGAELAVSLDAFARAGGVVVVLSGGLGANEMWAFATEAGLFPTTGFHVLPGASILDVTAPLDALCVGVATPLAAPVSAGWWELPSGGNWDVVLSDHVTQKPLVVHRAVPPKP